MKRLPRGRERSGYHDSVQTADATNSAWAAKPTKESLFLHCLWNAVATNDVPAQIDFYSVANGRMLRDLIRDAAQPDLIKRLLKVQQQRLSYRSVRAAEESKIALSERESVTAAMDFIEAGLAETISQQQLEPGYRTAAGAHSGTGESGAGEQRHQAGRDLSDRRAVRALLCCGLRCRHNCRVFRWSGATISAQSPPVWPAGRKPCSVNRKIPGTSVRNKPPDFSRRFFYFPNEVISRRWRRSAFEYRHRPQSERRGLHQFIELLQEVALTIGEVTLGRAICCQRHLPRLHAVLLSHLIQPFKHFQTTIVEVTFDHAFATLTFAGIRFGAGIFRSGNRSPARKS